MPADMPVPAGLPSAGGPPAGLAVGPFRGLRYDEKVVPDLAAVTSPPYDVVDAVGARSLEALHPFNVVRLILPRDLPEAAGAGRYERARATLATWLQNGILRQDERPAVYVYDQVRDGMHQRGLLATIGLRQPEERIVLPHEDVLPGPVQDRLELMRTTAANLEPILLVYDGGGPAAEVMDAAAEQRPLLVASTADGITHRIWSIDDPIAIGAISADLAPRQVLIADGHHRYATYLALQAEHREAGDGPGPWDSGLALLVDSTRFPLQLSSIARVIEGLALPAARAALQDVFAVQRPCSSLAEGVAALTAESTPHPFLLSDGNGAFELLSNPAPSVLGAVALGSAGGPPLDARVLHELMLERLLRIEDSDDRVRYVHDPGTALRTARSSAGTAVLMRPVRLADVVSAAARGERMPRKSTSFGPKPRTGFVMRLLEKSGPVGRSSS